MQKINQLILSYSISTQQFCQQINQFAYDLNVDVVQGCRFKDSCYEIIVQQSLQSEKFRRFLTEIELLCRSHGSFDSYVVASALGLKFIIRVYDQEI